MANVTARYFTDEEWQNQYAPGLNTASREVRERQRREEEEWWQQSKGANIESCVAYHMKVWPMSKDVVQKIDKRMEKLIIKFEKQ